MSEHQNTLDALTVPEAWQRLPLERMHGVVLVVGDVDTGKSTLIRYLWHRLWQLRGERARLAVLDGDIGQAVLGPPTTQTVRTAHPEDPARFPPRGRFSRWFVGSTSPRGHMLPTVIGLHRLVQRARTWGAHTILVDTTGMIRPNLGGVALKWAKFDLLQPRVVIALQREKELEPLIGPWRHSRRFHLIELPVSPLVRRRSREERIAWRQYRFQLYFRRARALTLSVENLTVLGGGRLEPGRVLGLLDREGYAVGIGVLKQWRGEMWEVLTPVSDLRRVDAVRLGHIVLDPTWRDRRYIPLAEANRPLQADAPVAHPSAPDRDHLGE